MDNSLVTPSTFSPAYDIIVFSHLRWEFVFQRPQHIISRLAKKYNVLFVEEPVAYNETERNTYNSFNPMPGVTVWQPRVKSINAMPALLNQYLGNTEQATAWFYSAAFVDVLNKFSFRKVIYDCMDELTLFQGAPQELQDQEEQLLAKAHVVFTGGKLLFEAKKKRHANVYCFPSSVDVKHFQKALNGIEVPADMNFKRPVIGYYGVIDERIDYDLIRESAALMPDVSFVMIGPVVKVDPAHLPQAANLHYLGMKPYAYLPHYLKGMDIAMMPFALNPSTKFISPTKTLEYMAAHKPIISTPIYDVIRDYGSFIEIVANAQGFAHVARKILSATWEARPQMVKSYTTILNNTSWDITVQKMDQLAKPERVCDKAMIS